MNHVLVLELNMISFFAVNSFFHVVYYTYCSTLLLVDKEILLAFHCKFSKQSLHILLEIMIQTDSALLNQNQS